MRPPKPNSVEPPWYGTRMPGGVGGVASRGVPLSRSWAEMSSSQTRANVQLVPESRDQRPIEVENVQSTLLGAWRSFDLCETDSVTR